MEYPTAHRSLEISKKQDVKAAHLSSNPINGKPESNNGTAHFEVEVEKRFSASSSVANHHKITITLTSKKLSS